MLIITTMNYITNFIFLQLYKQKLSICAFARARGCEGRGAKRSDGGRTPVEQIASQRLVVAFGTAGFWSHVKICSCLSVVTIELGRHPRLRFAYSHYISYKYRNILYNISHQCDSRMSSAGKIAPKAPLYETPPCACLTGSERRRTCAEPNRYWYSF